MYTATKLWNSLPESLKSINTLQGFKKEIKILLFEKLHSTESQDFIYYQQYQFHCICIVLPASMLYHKFIKSNFFQFLRGPQWKQANPNAFLCQPRQSTTTSQSNTKIVHTRYIAVYICFSRAMVYIFLKTLLHLYCTPCFCLFIVTCTMLWCLNCQINQIFKKSPTIQHCVKGELFSDLYPELVKYYKNVVSV